MKKFWPLFWTQGLGALVDNLFKTLFLVYIVFHDISLFGIQSQNLMALGTAVFMLPFFLLSASAGQLASHLDKINLTRWIKRGELFLIVIVIWGIRSQRMDVLFLCLFLLGVQSTFFGPIKYALVPHLVDEHHITKANAWIEAATFSAILLGTIMGTELAKDYLFLNIAPWILLIFSMGGVLASQALPKKKAKPRIKQSSKMTLHPWHANLDLFRTFKFKFKLLKTMMLSSWFWILAASLTTLLPVLVKQQLQGNENTVQFFLLLFTLGIILGSLISAPLERRFGVAWSLNAGFFCSALCLFLLGSLPLSPLKYPIAYMNLTELDFVLSCVCLMLTAAGSGLTVVLLYSQLQRLSEPHVLSKTIALNNIINAGAMVAVSVILSFILDRAIISKIFWILGIMNLCVIAWWLYWKKNGLFRASKLS